MPTLAQTYDCLLLDLDGTVYRGADPVDGARDALAEARDTRALYVTNNASRSADAVAEHLRDLGFAADVDDVVTSAQAAAHLLASQLPADAAVLVVGTDALAAEVSAVGLRPVRDVADAPAAVVQGHSPHTAWRDLAEAALALHGGALWVAANVDSTYPSERGLLPGNGSMVAALRATTGGEPQVAGKPGRALLDDALARGEFSAPLVVGDRLDTDIAGGHVADLPSLLVLTGVSTAAEAAFADPAQRPTYLAADLSALHRDVEASRVAPQPGWDVRVDGDTVRVRREGQAAPDTDDGLAVVRAVAHAAAQVAGATTCVAEDDDAASALRRWGLPTGERD